MTKRPEPNEVVEAACELFRVSRTELLDKLRRKNVVGFRRITAYVLRHFGYNDLVIGLAIERDRTTIRSLLDGYLTVDEKRLVEILIKKLEEKMVIKYQTEFDTEKNMYKIHPVENCEGEEYGNIVTLLAMNHIAAVIRHGIADKDKMIASMQSIEVLPKGEPVEPEIIVPEA